MDHIIVWAIFGAVVALSLVMDLGLMERKDREMSVHRAVMWSFFWVTVSLAFNGLIYFDMGSEAAMNFFTAYAVEKSLSIDNLFVFLMIFSYFKVPNIYQHRVLYWGILASIILRAIFIMGGLALINLFSWTTYVFGIILLFAAIKTAFGFGEEDVGNNKVIKFVQRMVPVTSEYHGHDFWIQRDGKRLATPLFIALLVVEISDLIFACDSVPAVLGIVRDPMIVFTSNIFAILGLRSMYFVLAFIMKYARFMNVGLSIVIAFVAVKLLGEHYFKFSTAFTLTFIAATLSLTVLLSAVFPGNKQETRGLP